MATNRMCTVNRVTTSGVAVTASSTNAAFPLRRLLNQQRSDVWRTKLGWTIVAGFNDKIDFNRGGVKVATIVAGNYPTAAALCTAIVTALEAADSTPVWACSYNGSTFKFTLSSDIAFTLLFSTGTNVATSVHLDLGYTSTDKGSATSQVAENTSYQSRHWLKADLGSSLAVTFAAAINHNVSSGGTIVIQGNGTDAWTGALTLSQALSTSMNETVQSPVGRLAFFNSASVRYLRLLITDVQNSVGYFEVGTWWVGPYDEPAQFSNSFTRNRNEMSQVIVALRGAHYQNQRPTQRELKLEWSPVTDAQRIVLETAFDRVPKGKCFFFALDATGDAANTLYAYLDGNVSVPLKAGLLWTLTASLAEAMP